MPTAVGGAQLYEVSGRVFVDVEKAQFKSDLDMVGAMDPYVFRPAMLRAVWHSLLQQCTHLPCQVCGHLAGESASTVLEARTQDPPGVSRGAT